MPRGPMGRGGNPSDKAKDFKGAMKRLFSELKPFKMLICIALVLSILGSIMSIIAPNQLSNLTDTISEGLMGPMNMDAIKKIALILASLYILSALFTFIESICMTDVANKFAKSLRSRISIKINKLPLRYFDKNSIGDTLSRVTNDVDTIAQSMNQSIATLVSSITLFLGTILMMFVTNWIMALTAIFSSLIGFVLMFVILGKSQKYFVSRQEELGNLNGHIEEVYSGLNVVKVYNGKKHADEKFDDLNKKVYEANRKSQFLSGLMRANNEFYRKLWICCSMYSRSITYNE